MSDLIDRQAAIEAIDAVFPVDPMKSVHTQGIALGAALAKTYIEQLPSAQPEPCEYCNEDSDGYVKPIEKNNHAFVRFGMNGWELSLRANGWHGSTKIMYCPMCGRELKHG